MKVFNNHKVKVYWTIWAIGFHRICDFQGKTSDLQIFIGPVILTFWR